MPLLKITLSAADETGELRDTLLAEGTRIVAEVLGKSPRYVMVVCESEAIALGGSREPAAFLDVRAIGGLDEDTNAELTRALCDLLHDTAGIATDRVFATFTDVPRTDWGWDGTTFSRR